MLILLDTVIYLLIIRFHFKKTCTGRYAVREMADKKKEAQLKAPMLSGGATVASAIESQHFSAAILFLHAFGRCACNSIVLASKFL